MRVPRNFNITLVEKTLITRERVKYLGVVFDTKRNFYDHIEVICAREDAIVGANRGLLPNVNGPTNACRKHSVLPGMGVGCAIRLSSVSGCAE